MNPYEAIRLIELDLRQLVRVVLGLSWLSTACETGVVDMARLEAKVADERGRRPAAVVSTDPLDYTEFSQLQALILEKQWNAFAPALGKRKHIEAYLSKISGFRNPTMHARALLPFEEYLVLGISGELRNRIAIYRNTLEHSSMYYPVVDSITDNFGNTHDGVTNAITLTGVRLEIGETITFTCRATDPMNRELTWRLSNNAIGNSNNDRSEVIGNEVVLSYTFARSDVSEQVPLLITLRSSGEFHRHAGHEGFDATAMFYYAVNPPTEDSFTLEGE